MADHTALPPDANEQIRRRVDKLEGWRARGIHPFGGRFPVTHWGGELQARFKDAGEEALLGAGAVALAGRVMAVRHHGKTCFAHLQDMSGRIQLYARADALGDAFAAFVDLDVGDFVGVTGNLFRTRTGELTVAAKQFEFLAKALRPLPEKWHGLTGRRDPLPPALRGPHREPRGARDLPRPEPHHRRPARASSTRAASSRWRRR